jgi:hypothetical protein
MSFAFCGIIHSNAYGDSFSGTFVPIAETLLLGTNYNINSGNLSSYSETNNKLVQYGITTTISGNGTISCPSYVEHGFTDNCTVTPAPYNQVLSVTGCGGIWSGNNPFVTAIITGECSVSAVFAGIQPTINGSAASSVTVGDLYSFTPSAANTVNYSIENKPTWATFDSNTGLLSGTPTSLSLGVNNNIIITAHNGTLLTALPAFNITVLAGLPAVTTPSPLGGTFSSAQTITLSTNKQATIYYALNGSMSYSVYSAPITINSSSYLNYYSVDSSGNTEAVTQQTYTINTNTGNTGGTQVPVMDGLWMLPGILAGLGLFARRRKE